MQCRVCGAPMPSGASTCPYCGTVEVPTANQQGYGAPLPPPSYDGPYQQPGPAGYNQQPPYQQPGPAGYNQQQRGPAGYNQQQPYQQPGPAGYNQQSAPPTPYQHPGSAFYNKASARSPYPGRPGYGQKPAKKTPWGIVVGIVALVVVIGVVVSLVATSMFNPSSTATTNSVPTSVASTPASTVVSTPTPVPATPTAVATSTPLANSTAPSGNAIDADAAQIVTNPETSSAVDTNTLEAPSGTVTSTFKVNAPIYVIFHLDATKFSTSTETDYVNVRFYTGSTSIVQNSPLQIKAYETVGYFEAKYYTATTAGAAEIYWCHVSNCSDGKLAQVVHFTVTN
jgi:hypothetical protein